MIKLRVFVASVLAGVVGPCAVILRRRDEIRVFDAKYKAHFAELDESGWLRVAQQVRESHRADLHQVLAYAALFDAPKITTTLVYPLRPATFAALRARGRDVARAELLHGGAKWCGGFLRRRLGA